MAARSEGDGLERILISEQIKDQKLDLLARSLRTSAERIAKETGMPVMKVIDSVVRRVRLSLSEARAWEDAGLNSPGLTPPLPLIRVDSGDSDNVDTRIMAIKPQRDEVVDERDIYAWTTQRFNGQDTPAYNFGPAINELWTYEIQDTVPQATVAFAETTPPVSYGGNAVFREILAKTLPDWSEYAALRNNSMLGRSRSSVGFNLADSSKGKSYTSIEDALRGTVDDQYKLTLTPSPAGIDVAIVFEEEES